MLIEVPTNKLRKLDCVFNGPLQYSFLSYNIRYADGWIRTADLWCRNRHALSQPLPFNVCLCINFVDPKWRISGEPYLES